MSEISYTVPTCLTAKGSLEAMCICVCVENVKAWEAKFLNMKGSGSEQLEGCIMTKFL
jgi:hypothetical protein